MVYGNVAATFQVPGTCDIPWTSLGWSQGLVTSLGHPWDGPRDLAWFCTVPGTIRSVQKIPNTDIWFEFRVKSPDRTKMRSNWVKIGIYWDWNLELGLGQFSLGLSLGQKFKNVCPSATLPMEMLLAHEGIPEWMIIGAEQQTPL